MKRTTILALLLVGCATPFVGHVHTQGDGAVHFDGRYLAVKGTGKIEVGITDKAGAYIYPPGVPLKLEGDYAVGVDIKAKDDPATPEDEKKIGYEAAAKLLGIEGE